MKIIHFLFISLILLGYSCKKDTVGVSKTTTYVTFDLTGGATVTIPKGGAYVDPGYKAMEGTTDVTSKVTTDSNVDGTKVGMYTVTYSAINTEGFPSSTERTVIIYDPAAPNVDLAGNYKASVQRVSPARSFSDLKVTVQKVAPGFFHVSDFFGGFYDQGSNYKYGPDYAMTGYFQLNPDNTVTLISSHINGWGDSLNKLTNGKYDAASKTLSWDAFYSSSNYDFKVTLVKQ